jgi:hypothetical protein
MRGNTRRSLGLGTLVERSRRRGGSRSLPLPAAANHRRLAKPAIPGPSKPSSVTKVVAPGSSKPPSAEPTQERGPSSPLSIAEAVAGGVELSMDISVDDYRVGGIMMFDARTGRGLVGEFLCVYYLFIYYCFF